MEGNQSTAKLVYILYLVGLVIGLTALVGVIIAYMSRDDADEVVRSHFNWQIRTFWIGLLLMLIGVPVMSLFWLGWLMSVAVLAWIAARAIVGMSQLGRGEPVPDVETLLW